MARIWCGGLTISDAKAFLREYREAVSGPGRYQGCPAWVAWLDSIGDPTWDIGSVEERGYAAYWVPDRSDDARDRLFRDLRDPTVTAVILEEDNQGFVSGLLWRDSLGLLESTLSRHYGQVCDHCLEPAEGQDTFDAPGYPRDRVWCDHCAAECPDCGDVYLLDTEMVDGWCISCAKMHVRWLRLLSPDAMNLIERDLVGVLAGDDVVAAQEASDALKLLRGVAS